MASAISFKRPTPSTAAAGTPATQPAAQPAAIVNAVPAAAKPVTPVAQPTPAATPTPQPTPAAPQPEAALAVQADGTMVSDDYYNGVGGFEGEFSAKDMRVPYLSICGPSSETFKADPSLLGQFVLNKTIPLGETIRVIFFRATKRYVEDLPFDSPIQPRRFNSRADYVAAGMTDSQMKDVADLDLLVEVPTVDEKGEPNGVEEFADLFVGDKAYLLGRYTVQSTAYGKMVPALMGDMKGFLKGNLVNGYYDLTTTKGSGKNLYYYPTPKTAGSTAVELRRAIVDRVAPPVTQAAA
jgi:hypothetical protein